MKIMEYSFPNVRKCTVRVGGPNQSLPVKKEDIHFMFFLLAFF